MLSNTTDTDGYTAIEGSTSRHPDRNRVLMVTLGLLAGTLTVLFGFGGAESLASKYDTNNDNDNPILLAAIPALEAAARPMHLPINHDLQVQNHLHQNETLSFHVVKIQGQGQLPNDNSKTKTVDTDGHAWWCEPYPGDGKGANISLDFAWIESQSTAGITTSQKDFHCLDIYWIPIISSSVENHSIACCQFDSDVPGEGPTQKAVTLSVSSNTSTSLTFALSTWIAPDPEDASHHCLLTVSHAA